MSIRLIISFKFCLSLWLCDVLIFSIILYNIFFWYWFACNRWFRQDIICNWSLRHSYCLNARIFRELHLYIYITNFYSINIFHYYCTRRSLGTWKLAFKSFDLNSIPLLFVITNLNFVLEQWVSWCSSTMLCKISALCWLWSFFRRWPIKLWLSSFHWLSPLYCLSLLFFITSACTNYQ